MSIEKRTGEGEAGVGEAWSGSILRMCDLDCWIIVFRRQFTSSVYFSHATPPGLCHCRLIAWLVELVLFYHSMVAARHVAQDKYAPHPGPCLSHSCLSLSRSLLDAHVPLLPPLSLTISLSLLLALSGVYVVLCWLLFADYQNALTCVPEQRVPEHRP